jgi:hypothetical protein
VWLERPIGVTAVCVVCNKHIFIHLSLLCLGLCIVHDQAVEHAHLAVFESFTSKLPVTIRKQEI